LLRFTAWEGVRRSALARIQPRLERGPAEPRARAGEQNAGLVGEAVDWVADLLDAQAVATSDGEQPRHLDEVLGPWSGDLERRPGRCGGIDRQIGKRLGDRARGDQLRARLRDVEIVASHRPLAEGHASRPMKNDATGSRNRDTPFVI
jgi:hypothetical protein